MISSNCRTTIPWLTSRKWAAWTTLVVGMTAPAGMGAAAEPTKTPSAGLQREPPATSAPLSHETNDAVRKAAEKLRELTQWREGLAASLKSKTSPVTEDDFVRVCQPVGRELQRWSQEKGYDARQISRKARNPKALPQNDELEIYRSFEGDPAKSEEIVSSPGLITYYQRIPVAESCLVCHGAKNKRPDFIARKYPQDLAFDFKAGDLRGLYQVRIPIKAGGPAKAPKSPR